MDGVDIDAVHRKTRTYKSCVSNCDQGRKPCTSPDECQRSDDLAPATGILVSLCLVAAIVGFVILVHFLLA